MSHLSEIICNHWNERLVGYHLVAVRAADDYWTFLAKREADGVMKGETIRVDDDDPSKAVDDIKAALRSALTHLDWEGW